MTKCLPSQIREEKLIGVELRADAELFKVDEGFARSLGIEMTPFEVTWGLKGVRVREAGVVPPPPPGPSCRILVEGEIPPDRPRRRTS